MPLPRSDADVAALLAAYRTITDPQSGDPSRRSARLVFLDLLEGLTHQQADRYYTGVRAIRDAQIAAEPPDWPGWTMDDLEETP